MFHPTDRPGLQRAALAAACALGLLAGALPAPGPARAQEAASAVQDVVIENVGFAFGDTTVRAPRVTVSGTRLTREDLLAILSSTSTESWPARAARLDAGSLTIPELVVERVADGRRQTATYRDVVARGVQGGRIAGLGASGAALATEAGSGGDGKPRGNTGSYGRIDADAVDLAALARLYTEAGDGKGAWLRLYAGFSVEEAAFTDDRGTRVRFARVTGSDLSARQTPTTWTGAFEAFGATDLADADPARRAKLTGMAADLAEAVSIGTLEVSGLSVHETTGPEPVDIAAARLAYAGNGPEAGVTLTDLTVSAQGARAKVGRLALTGFSLAPTIATLRRLAQDPGLPDSELRRLTPAIGTLSLADVSVDLPREAGDAPGGARDPLAPGREAGKDKAESPPASPPEAPLQIGLRGGAFTLAPPQDGVPTASRLALTGLTLPASAVAGVPGLGSLGLYGYQDLDLSIVADTAWNGGARELALREISVAGKGMGTLRLNATLGGIGPEMFDPDTAVSSFAMLSATAKALDLSLENGGLFERFIASQAKGLSLKPDELRQEYVTASLIGIPVILGNSAAAKAIGAAMGKFVAKPGILSITVKAKNGAGLGMVDFSTAPTPAAVLDKLEVTAKAE